MWSSMSSARPRTRSQRPDPGRAFRLLARLVRHGLNRGNVLEGPLRDRIADGGNPGCQGQVSTQLRRTRGGRRMTQWAIRRTTPKGNSKVGFLQPEPPSLIMVSRVHRGPALGRTGLVSEETIMLTGNQPLPRLARTPWNKGRLIGQKRPLKPKDVWAIRVRLQLEQRKRDLARVKSSPHWLRTCIS
jgi:hypothetical protein